MGTLMDIFEDNNRIISDFFNSIDTTIQTIKDKGKDND